MKTGELGRDLQYDDSMELATAGHDEPEGDPLPYGMRGCYQRPDATMTLREGLEEYYRVNPGLSDPATIEDPVSARYFHNHDSTHVVFGTHTGPLHEGVNDFWTFFAVDIRVSDYVRGFFATDESKKIAKDFASWDVIVQSLRSLRLVFEIRRRAKSMHAKWPWDPSEALLDRPLDQIRKEYGIRVFRPEALLGLEPEPEDTPRPGPSTRA